MKSSNEMICDLYERREQYQKERKDKQAKRMKVLMPVGCACILALIGVGVWKSGLITDRTNPVQRTDDAHTKPGADSQLPGTPQKDQPADPFPTGESKEQPEQNDNRLPGKEEGSGLEFWLTENVDNVDFSKYQRRYGLFGGWEYYGTGYVPTEGEGGEQKDPDAYVIYTVTSYPDYSDIEHHITRIMITDPKVSVFGLTKQSSVEEIEPVMLRLGYRQEDYGSDNGVLYRKGKVTIHFSEQWINIRFDVSNEQGIYFKAREDGNDRSCLSVPAGSITRISLMYQPEGKLYNIEDKEVISTICNQLHEISGTHGLVEEGMAGPFFLTLYQEGENHVAAYELLTEQDIWEEMGGGMLIHSDTVIPLYAYFKNLITHMEPVKGIECLGRLD